MSHCIPSLSSSGLPEILHSIIIGYLILSVQIEPLEDKCRFTLYSSFILGHKSLIQYKE